LEETLPLELRPLALEAILAAQRDGAEVLDTRDPAEFARGHLAGSLHIGLGGRFATWAGTLIPLDRGIVIVATPGREREAAIRLGRVGFDRVLGYLDGGIDAARGKVALIERPRRVAAEEVSSLVVSGVPLVDVRSHLEHAQETIPGSYSIPLPQLTERLREVPEGRVLVYCRSGERSSTAASLLERAGRIDVLDLAGGITAWKKTQRPEPAQT
jgi:rhodanese-related sulfurtransferase